MFTFGQSQEAIFIFVRRAATESLVGVLISCKKIVSTIGILNSEAFLTLESFSSTSAENHNVSKFDECNRTEQNCLLLVEIKAAILSVIREPTEPPSSLISFSTSSLGRSSFEPRTNLNPFSESGRLAEDSVLKLYNPLENSCESTSNEVILFFFHDYFFGRITFHRSGK